MNFILWFLVILFALFIAAGFGLSFYFTRRMKRTAFHTPAEYGLEFEDVTFPATDGLRLRGCWIPAPDSIRTVIILHGHGGSLDWDLHRAPSLHEAGFNVFLFDFRAHGLSEGRLATFGYLERRDVLGAIEFIQSRSNQSMGMKQHIGLMGFSYGAIASMLTAPLTSDIRAVVADGGPTRMRIALIAHGMDLGLPRWLAICFSWVTIIFTSIRFLANQLACEPIRWVGKISPRPILFVHGELDKYVPDFDELYAAAREPKEAWRVVGVAHTKVSEAYPEEFRRRVIEFFDRNL
jgi:fermentation-respiration switch protein FrsA (DUF1100 family)